MSTAVREYHRDYYKRNRTVIDARVRARTQHNKRFLRAVKETAGCVDCGESDPDLLHFDHLEDKKFGLAQCGSRSFPTVVAEVMKCEVRCYSHHALRHYLTEGMSRGMRGHSGS